MWRRDSLSLTVIFMSLLLMSQRSVDIWVGPGESWIHLIMGCGAVGTCAGGRKSESWCPPCFQYCSTDVRLGLWPWIWDGDLIPLVRGLFGESLAIAGRTLCPTSGCWERLKWDLLPAYSVSISCGCMDMWLVFLMLILPTRFFQRGSLLSGGGQWADHIPHGCSSLIGISRRWGWARHLPGGWPDGGSWSTGRKWTQWRSVLAHAPYLTWADLMTAILGNALPILFESDIGNGCKTMSLNWRHYWVHLTRFCFSSAALEGKLRSLEISRETREASPCLMHWHSRRLKNEG